MKIDRRRRRASETEAKKRVKSDHRLGARPPARSIVGCLACSRSAASLLIGRLLKNFCCKAATMAAKKCQSAFVCAWRANSIASQREEGARSEKQKTIKTLWAASSLGRSRSPARALGGRSSPSNAEAKWKAAKATLW